jgi:hypothetical protein
MAAGKIRIAPDAKKAAFFLLWLFMRRFDRAVSPHLISASEYF